MTTTTPQHIAIIMDGNRREGTKRSGDALAGHRLGVEVVRTTVEEASTQAIPYLTFFAFSDDNWKRSATEVGHLMDLFRQYFTHEIDSLISQGVRVKFIGRRDRLAKDIVAMMRSIEERSHQNNKITVTFAIDYGGRDEVVRAAKKFLLRCVTFRVWPHKISEAFAKCLDTHFLPDVDLLLRTSGEMRTSGFLLWSAAYAELMFVPENWPAFSREHFDAALAEYQQRQRRFGA